MNFFGQSQRSAWQYAAGWRRGVVMAARPTNISSRCRPVDRCTVRRAFRIASADDKRHADRRPLIGDYYNVVVVVAGPLLVLVPHPPPSPPPCGNLLKYSPAVSLSPVSAFVNYFFCCLPPTHNVKFSRAKCAPDGSHQSLQVVRRGQ